MPNRIIKESIWTSPNLNRVSNLAELHFYRLLPLPDDHGCCEVSPAVVKGRCYPLRDKVTVAMIEAWNGELENADLIRTWWDNGRQFGWFPKWKNHQRIRSLHQRKTPEPPDDVINRQVSTSDRLNPNLNPNPNPDSPSEKDRASSRNVKTHPRLEFFLDSYQHQFGKEYIIGNYREEGGAAKRTVSKVPDEAMYRQAVRAYLASNDNRLVENGHPYMWFIREMNRWVTQAQRYANATGTTDKYADIYE